MPDIPPEILIQILTHVRDNGGPDIHLDLLSCSMVSHFWFDYAWPLAAESFNQNQPLDLDAYNTVQLSYMVVAITRLRQLGVLKSTLPTSVMIVVNKQLFEQTAHRSRSDITMRLIHALQPPSKALEIHIPGNFDAKQAANIQNFVSKLYSNTTSLRISGGRFKSVFFQLWEPLTWLNILIHDLRHQLHDITIAGTYPPSFIHALSKCPNIRSVSIKSTSDFSEFSAVVAKWPELQSLKILGSSSEIDPIVERLALNTPKHLESLHFEHCNTPQLRNLIISLAPRLVHLVLPSQDSENSENSDELLNLIASLNMPCLQHLDLSNLANSLTAKNVVQQHWVEGQPNPMSLLRWPKLQRINLCFCQKISPLFLKLVMASCPALDGVRFGDSPGDIFEYRYCKNNPGEMLKNAGWTQSTRSIGYGWCGNAYTSTLTFMRPGGDVWEVEEWVETIETTAVGKKIDQYHYSGCCRPILSSKQEVDGVVVVRCIDIECERQFISK